MVGCTLLLGSAGTASAQVSIGAPPGPLTWECSNSFVGSQAYCGQSFIVPMSHSVLESFTLHLATSSDLQFRIYASSDALTGSALFTQSIAAAGGTAASPQTFTPTGGLALSPGALYFALVHIEHGESVLLHANPSNAYADGQFITCHDRTLPATCRNLGWFVADHDLAFTATFVSAQTTTPEPATVALVGGGLLALGAVARRRQRAA